MIAFSDRFTLVFLLVCSGILIASGIGMIVHGAYKKINTPKNIIEELENTMADGTSNIITGSFDIIVGVCGVAGALLKHKILLLITSAMLALIVTWNFCSMVGLGIYGTEAQKNVGRSMRESIIKSYGNNSVQETRLFTSSVDKNQRDDLCCGWSGVDGENLFLKSPWYGLINTNSTTGKPRTLPDSCCAKPGLECQLTENVKEARNNGFVYKRDCLDLMVFNLKYFMWSSIIHLMLVTLVQMAVLAFSGLMFIQRIKGQ